MTESYTLDRTDLSLAHTIDNVNLKDGFVNPANLLKCVAAAPPIF
jgi:hypothetical protein